MKNASEIHSIVILTGAGISAESGIKTFRDHNGLWENHSIEQVATPQGFMQNPSLVYRFYNERRKQLLSKEVQPNAAHSSVAKLETKYKEKLLLVTQNVDNLHERAGSQFLLHMHGELLKMRCQLSGQVFNIESDFNEKTPCLCCHTTANLRPHIVWFGEMPMYMREIYQALEECDLFLSIGTSGNVYPAAGFAEIAKHNGKSFNVEFNQESTAISKHFDKQILGPATETVPKFIESLL